MAERNLLFGDDLRLREVSWGLDLVPALGDLELIHGADTISQALRMRLVVRQGELAGLGWPDYGSRLHELIGQPNLARTQGRAMTLAREAIEADPRVVKVSTIQATVRRGDRDAVRLEIDVDLITQPTPLNLVVDVALGAR
ncbi:MAG: GPW/gp25 family protein [Actinobacteria bacterium]|nr:GPW/gp25 family protein [Actinomycetota bacterium]